MRYVTKELAQKIVYRTMEIIDCNINVMNEKGVIIGSGDKKRMDQIHEGALMVLKAAVLTKLLSRRLTRCAEPNRA